MLEYFTRPFTQKYLFNRLANKIPNQIHPNIITLLAILSGIATAFLLYYNKIYAATVALILSGSLDILDGIFARLQGKSSNLGAALDIIGDRIVEFSVIFGLFLLNPVTRALPVIIMLGSVLICITSFLIVGIFTENNSQKSFYYHIGLMERAEAFIFFILMMIFPQAFNVLAWTFSSLVLLTAIIRFFQFAFSNTLINNRNQ